MVLSTDGIGGSALWAFHDDLLGMIYYVLSNFIVLLDEIRNKSYEDAS